MNVTRVQSEIQDLLPFIDWSPLFSVFELHGRYPNRGYPNIFKDEVVGAEALKLFNEANEMLLKVSQDKSLQAKGVIGLFPANSQGEDVVIWSGSDRSTELTRLCMLRQQIEKENEHEAYVSLVDFIRPSPVQDHIGMFACSVFGADEMAKEFEKHNDDFNKILILAIADRLAEAFAEKIHFEIRKTIWGFVPNEELDLQNLLKTKHQGIRPAPGYPSQVDHTEKTKMWQLLSPETLLIPGSLAMSPAASVCALVFADEESHYFSVSGVDKDQVEDYAMRKGMTIKEVEKNLSQILSYDPDKT